MLVRTHRDGPIAVLALNRPPVNAMSQPLREAMWIAIEAADADPEIRAIVLTGSGNGFSAGGELAELRTPVQQAWPGISNDLLPRIENCSKPVVAAMHGFAIGGGLELALACHYRVARRDTRIALPEMKHGVVPPSGSQRMPRAIGFERSLQLMVWGETASAASFADTGLFDGLCDEDVVGAALRLAGSKLGCAAPAKALLRHRRLCPAEGTASIAAWRERLRAMPNTSTAMHRCVDAAALALTSPTFEAGLAAAKQIHDELAAALRAQLQPAGPSHA